MSLVLKRSLVLSATLAVVLALLGWWSYRLVLSEVQRHLAAEAALLAEHTAHSYQRIDQAVRDLVRLIETEWQQGLAPGAELQAALKERSNALAHLNALRVLDRDGNVIVQEAGSARPVMNQSKHHFFRVHLSSRHSPRMYLGDVQTETGGRAARSVASHPIIAPSGDFGGVVAAIFDPFGYRRIYADVLPGNERYELALLDAEGLLIAGSGALGTALAQTRGWPVTGTEALISSQRSQYLRLSLPSTGEDYMGFVMRVPAFPLFAYAGLPHTEALAPWRRILFVMGGIWLAGSLIAAGLFYGVWRRDQQRHAAFAAMQQANATARDALERAKAASAAKSRFLAHMSHELRTPLNAILGFSEVIRDRVLGRDGALDSEYAGLIHKSGEHLLQIINDLLDLSKIEAGKMTLRPELLDVEELFGSARELAGPELQERRIEIVTTLPGDCPKLYADPRAARQILINLLSNAVKFSPPGGRVDLTAEAVPDVGLVLSVADHGRGIAADRLETVFEPFNQSAVDTADWTEGTGLGLPLVKSLVEIHGGQIVLQSAPGEGTRATLTFPPPPAEPSDQG